MRRCVYSAHAVGGGNVEEQRIRSFVILLGIPWRFEHAIPQKIGTAHNRQDLSCWRMNIKVSPAYGVLDSAALHAKYASHGSVSHDRVILSGFWSLQESKMFEWR